MHLHIHILTIWATVFKLEVDTRWIGGSLINIGPLNLSTWISVTSHIPWVFTHDTVSRNKSLQQALYYLVHDPVVHGLSSVFKVVVHLQGLAVVPPPKYSVVSDGPCSPSILAQLRGKRWSINCHVEADFDVLVHHHHYNFILLM